MRGEDCSSSRARITTCGSPPHARGRPTAPSRSGSRARITPACAGKTPSISCTSPSSQDHPRMRGEDDLMVIGELEDLGSPPHARGRLVHDNGHGCAVRITPACAGKTSFDRYESHSSRDHPRMRGEDVLRLGDSEGLVGSPPHARGRPLMGQSGTREIRITPACAGKTPRVR